MTLMPTPPLICEQKISATLMAMRPFLRSFAAVSKDLGSNRYGVKSVSRQLSECVFRLTTVSVGHPVRLDILMR